MRKRTKRKVYALVNPIQYAIEGAAITPESELAFLRTRELASIDAFRMGKAGLQEWSDVSALQRITETMARAGIGPEALPVCAEAQQHLVESAKRFESIGKMGATGQALQCWRDLFEYHDLQRSSIPRSEYERMLTRATNRLKSKAPEVVEI